MKKNVRKKTSLIGIPVALMLVLTACGDGEEASGDGSETGTGSEEGEQEAGLQEPEELQDGSGDGSTLTFGTPPSGSSQNAVGNGLSTVLSEHSDELQVSVSTFAGTSAWGPLMNDEQVDLGTASGPESTWAYNGDHGFEETDSMRLLARGNMTKVAGAAVRKDSGYESMADLEGERVAADYPGSIIALKGLEAALAVNGLGWEDVNEVPVPSTTDGMTAIQDDSVDAAFALVPSTPKSQEVHNAVGLKALDFLDDYSVDEVDDIPEDVQSTVSDIVPGGAFTVIDAEGYIAEDTVGMIYPNYSVVGDHVSNDQVYEMLDTLWTNYEELHDIHPWLAQWKQEQMFDPDPSIPYHEGAIEFFKEKGVWNDEAEQKQQELMQ